MVDAVQVTSQPNTNGSDRRLSLPEAVTLNATDVQRMPSPGTQRALKAETGRDYLQLVGPDADSADRTQTQIWQYLRRTIPDLKWSECEDVAMILNTETVAPDPTKLASFVPSLPSVDTGE